MDCIARASVAEAGDERASNVQSGLALPAIICPISSSMRFTIRPWEAGRDRQSGTREHFSLALTGLHLPRCDRLSPGVCNQQRHELNLVLP